MKASYFFVLMFLSLCGYLVYFNIADRESINSNSYNTKQDTKDNMVIRGNIYSSDGEILATTNVAEDGSETREYPYDRVFAHVGGLCQQRPLRYGIYLEYRADFLPCLSF